RPLLLCYAVVEHGQAERAGGSYRLGTGADGFLDPLDVDPLADPLLHPHASATGAATEGALREPSHLAKTVLRGRPINGGRAEKLTGRGEDPIVPPEVARVVVRDPALDGLDRGERARTHELGKQLSVVDYFEVTADLAVLIGKRIEAVRAGGDDLLGVLLAQGLVERLDILLSEHLLHDLVAHPPSRVARARLTLAEDGERNASFVEQS